MREKTQYTKTAQRRSQKARRTPTDAERTLWQHLRARRLQGYSFRRQQAIGDYYVDFVCLQHKLIVELDGGQHAEQRRQDARRDGFLRQAGYRVLRFWSHEVLLECDAVLERVLGELEGKG